MNSHFQCCERRAGRCHLTRRGSSPQQHSGGCTWVISGCRRRSGCSTGQEPDQEDLHTGEEYTAIKDHIWDLWSPIGCSSKASRQRHDSVLFVGSSVFLGWIRRTLPPVGLKGGNFVQKTWQKVSVRLTKYIYTKHCAVFRPFLSRKPCIKFT